MAIGLPTMRRVGTIHRRKKGHKASTGKKRHVSGKVTIRKIRALTQVNGHRLVHGYAIVPRKHPRTRRSK